MASKSSAVVLLEITSCRSAFFALILPDGHYDILYAGAGRRGREVVGREEEGEVGYDALAE